PRKASNVFIILFALPYVDFLVMVDHSGNGKLLLDLLLRISSIFLSKRLIIPKDLHCGDESLNITFTYKKAVVLMCYQFRVTSDICCNDRKSSLHVFHNGI